MLYVLLVGVILAVCISASVAGGCVAFIHAMDTKAGLKETGVRLTASFLCLFSAAGFFHLFLNL